MNIGKAAKQYQMSHILSKCQESSKNHMQNIHPNQCKKHCKKVKGGNKSVRLKTANSIISAHIIAWYKTKTVVSVELAAFFSSTVNAES